MFDKENPVNKRVRATNNTFHNMEKIIHKINVEMWKTYFLKNYTRIAMEII